MNFNFVYSDSELSRLTFKVFCVVFFRESYVRNNFVTLLNTYQWLFKAWDQTSGTAGAKVDSSVDGGATAFSTQVEVATLTITAVNDLPVADLNGADGGGIDYSTSFAEGDSPVNITDSDATISDVDNATYNGLGINLGGFGDGTSELIRINGVQFQYGVTITQTTTVGSTLFEMDFDGSGFTITKSGGGTIPQADLQGLLLTVTYENTSETPTAGNRTLTIAAEDAGLLNASPAAISTISVTAVNDDPVVDHGIDPDRAERGVTARGRVIGRDAHQTVNAALGLEPAVGIVATDLVDRRFDARFFARAHGLQFDLVALLLGPAHIHARQDRSPVTAFGAACARVDLEEGVVAVRLAVQQSL